jgi:hypothetical protein
LPADGEIILRPDTAVPLSYVVYLQVLKGAEPIALRLLVISGVAVLLAVVLAIKRARRSKRAALPADSRIEKPRRIAPAGL